MSLCKATQDRLAEIEAAMATAITGTEVNAIYREAYKAMAHGEERQALLKIYRKHDRFVLPSKAAKGGCP